MGFASVQYVCTSFPHPGTSQVRTFHGLHASAAVERPQTTHSSLPFGTGGVAARAYDGARAGASATGGVAARAYEGTGTGGVGAPDELGQKSRVRGALRDEGLPPPQHPDDAGS